MSKQPAAAGAQSTPTVGIPARKIFTTIVEDAPPPRPAKLSAKTLAEQAAGLAAVKAYQAAPETPASE